MRSQAGDHAGAIALYEQAYHAGYDVELLPILATEYRLAGRFDDAVQDDCAYLAVEPAGPSAPAVRRTLHDLEIAAGRTAPYCSAPLQPAVTTRVVVVVAPAPAPRFSNRELAGFATAAVGLTAVALGIYYGHEASAISDQIANHDASTPWPDDIHRLEQQGQRDELKQKVMWGIGGAALVTAGVLYVTGRSDRLASERIAVTPSVGRSSAGIAISGGF